MKLSLKLQDHQQNNTTTIDQQNYPLLIRAKIPITIFNLPFLSTFSTTNHPSDLSLSLRTNFPTGPSLSLSYTPTSTTTTTTTTTAPLTLSLKSGVSLFGSPNNSPLIISANFSFSFSPHNPNPIFSLHFKPRLGSFSLRKTTTSSNPNPNPNPNPNLKEINGGDASSFGFVPLERPIGGNMGVNWKDLSVDSATKDSILSGILVMANTALPVTKRVLVNLRWGVNLPKDYGKQFPYLRVNKIRIERIEEAKKDDTVVKEKESNLGDFEMMKGMYSLMRRELNDLRKENREMKHTLEEIKFGQLGQFGQSVRNDHGYSGRTGGKKSGQVVNNSSGFEQWRNEKKSSVEENGQKEEKKNVNLISDVESELQRAIKAASS